MSRSLSLESMKKQMEEIKGRALAAREFFREKIVVSQSAERGSEVEVRTEVDVQTEREQDTQVQQRTLQTQVESNQAGDYEIAEVVEDIEPITLEEIDRSRTRLESVNSAIKIDSFFAEELQCSPDYRLTVKGVPAFSGRFKIPQNTLLIRNKSTNKIEMVLISPDEAVVIRKGLEKGFSSSTHEYALYFPYLKYMYPVEIARIEKDPQLEVLNMQFRLLSLNLNVFESDKPLIKRWLSGVRDLEAFENFYLKAGIARGAFHESAYRSSFIFDAIGEELKRRADERKGSAVEREEKEGKEEKAK